MALAPAITDLEHLKDRLEVARLLAWNPVAVKAGKFDRDELTIEIARPFTSSVKKRQPSGWLETTRASRTFTSSPIRNRWIISST